MNTKKSTRKRSAAKKKTDNDWLRRHSLGLMIGGIALGAVALGIAMFALIPFTGHGDKDESWIFIPDHSSVAAVKDSLKSNLGSAMGSRVYLVWRLFGGTPERTHGAYLAKSGQTALRLGHNLATGRQTPVRVTFNGTRTFPQLAEKIASQLEFSADSFFGACMSVLTEEGYTAETFPAAIIPDTYEFYWSASPENVVKRLLDYRNRFWTDSRKEKLARLGLTQTQAATLASIIEEETAKRDERPKVARLYLNRLEKGMRLQADPTVKFAVGDFAIRRIKGEHLRVKSPYNTYTNPGLPPGPIRIPSPDAIDDVLNAPEHTYLYMCAKEDFSGYHNFARDYATHLANAARYQAELNRRNIR